jgi:structural maintenance of chromosome 2
MFATALEVAAGNKLYQLVVDTEQTGKALLDSGSLKRKMTIIPMNKIKTSSISDRQIKTAKDLVGRETVFNALSLIDFEPQYKTVMEYVFGHKLICYSLDAAKQVAFHPMIMTSTITLKGDHFNPEGVLTGLLCFSLFFNTK